jgi:hypothetical protein
VSFRFQKTFHFDGRHAARAGGGDGLPVSPVLHVAGVKYAGILVRAPPLETM